MPSVLQILLVGVFLASLEMAIINPVLPQVVSDLQGAGLYPWVIAGHTIAATLTTPLSGWLADRLGRKPAYLLGISSVVVGSVFCGVATGMPVLLAGRVFQGFGAGSLMPVTLILLGDLLGASERARAFGWISLVWGLSTLISPFIGGVLADSIGWRGIFAAHLPVAGLLGWAFYSYVPEPVSQRNSQERPAFRELLSLPAQQAILLMGLPLGALIMGPLAYLPIRVRGLEGGSALDAGLALLPMSLAWTVGANLAGRILPRLGLKNLLRLGTGLASVGAILELGVHNLGLFVLGVGLGITISSANIAGHETAPPLLRGIATSLGITARNIGAVLSVPLLGYIAGFSPQLTDFSHIPHLALGLERVFQAVAVVGILAFLAILIRFPEIPQADHKTGQ